MTRPRPDLVWVPDRDWLRPDRARPQEEVSGRFLLMVTVLAAVVRFYHLGFQSLWVDEAMTWSMARPDLGLTLGEQLRDEIQGPLYLAAVWPLARWFGFSEFWLRFPAAVAGTFTAPLLALLGQRLCGGRSARLAALIVAVSPFHLWYSQEARGYAFLMFFATAASLAFLRLAERPTGRRVLGYALLAFATGASNFSGLFLLAGHALAVPLWVRPRGWRAWGPWLAAGGVAVTALAPWLLRAAGILAVDRLVPGAATGASLRGDTTLSPLALPFAGFVFCYGYSLGPSLTELHQPDRLAAIRAAWPVIAGGGAACLLPLAAGAARLGRRGGMLLGAWVVVPVALLVLLALRNFKPFNPRYLAAIFPLVMLVMAHGLGSLPRRLGRACGFALLGLFLWSLWGYHGDGRYAKEDMRDAAAWIGGRAEAADVVLVPVVTSVYRLYHQGPGRIVPFWELAPFADAGAAGQALRDRMGDAPRGFLVLARDWEIDPRGLLPGALAAQARVVEEKRYPGVRILEWRREPAPGGGGRP